MHGLDTSNVSSRVESSQVEFEPIRVLYGKRRLAEEKKMLRPLGPGGEAGGLTTAPSPLQFATGQGYRDSGLVTVGVGVRSLCLMFLVVFEMGRTVFLYKMFFLYSASSHSQNAEIDVSGFLRCYSAKCRLKLLTTTTTLAAICRRCRWQTYT